FAEGIGLVDGGFVGNDILNRGTIAIQNVEFGTGILVDSGAHIGTGTGDNIRNEGLIQVTDALFAAGIVVDGTDTDVAGHISNSGVMSISGADAVGIAVSDGAVVERGIINSGHGEILVTGSESAVGIHVGPGSVVGQGINNKGLIDVLQSETIIT